MSCKKTHPTTTEQQKHPSNDKPNNSENQTCHALGPLNHLTRHPTLHMTSYIVNKAAFHSRFSKKVKNIMYLTAPV